MELTCSEQWAAYIPGARTWVQSEAKDGAIGRQFQFLSIVFVCKECAEILRFDFDLKNNTMVLWTDNLIAIRSVRKNGISWENGIKTVYDLQSYWTSMAAILASLFS
jgi:hypothetical protein